ncbi:hypothetical protein Vafri_17630 [Volvox africanus]|uniref:Transmembrane protein n=1 Tax=Volvox africanus TaxID=51714 RepID=A0A8J4FAB3_9CHLO|nr:hypothetical protein Vafri_17630 [Volvox africanus]
MQANYHVPFRSGRISEEEARQRDDITTTWQLGRLISSPEFIRFHKKRLMTQKRRRLAVLIGCLAAFVAIIATLAAALSNPQYISSVTQQLQLQVVAQVQKVDWACFGQTLSHLAVREEDVAAATINSTASHEPVEDAQAEPVHHNSSTTAAIPGGAEVVQAEIIAVPEIIAAPAAQVVLSATEPETASITVPPSMTTAAETSVAVSVEPDIDAHAVSISALSATIPDQPISTITTDPTPVYAPELSAANPTTDSGVTHLAEEIGFDSMSTYELIHVFAEPIHGLDFAPNATERDFAARDTGTFSMTVLIVASSFLVLFLATVLVAYVAALHAEFGYVFTDNAGIADWDSPVHRHMSDAVVEDAEQPLLADGQTDGLGNASGADAVGVVRSPVPVPITAVEVPSSIISKEMSPIVSGSLYADSPSTSSTETQLSPLLHAALLNAAASQTKPPGVPCSLGSYSSPVPFAVALMTPAEPPSLFPGFPTLSPFGSQALPDGTAGNDDPCHVSAEDSPSFPSEVLAVEPAMAELNAVEAISPVPPQSDNKSTSTWGSSNASTGDQNLFPKTVTPENSEYNISGSPGATPWPLNHPDDEIPCSSAASRANGGDLAIFDLDRFNDEGEEVISISAFTKAAEDASAKKDVIAEPNYKALRRQVKLRFPSRKAVPCGSNDTARNPDTAHPDTCPTAGSDKVAISKLLVPMENAKGGADAATPTWPPMVRAPGKPAGGLDVQDDDLISVEAEKVVTSLLRDDPGPIIGGSWSDRTDRARSLPHSADGLCQARQDPGRQYAAVAAATSVLLSNLKGHAKNVVLAACAEDESTLRTAQGELHADSARLLDLDLAPHSYTASAGACKALAYSTAGTPISVLPNNRTTDNVSASDGGSWASIGSRVVADCSTPTHPSDDATSSPVLSVPPPIVAPVVKSHSIADGSSSRTSDSWGHGPLPLPDDIDSYLAAMSVKRVSSAASVMAELQSTLAFTSLLINSASYQLFVAQKEAREWRACALAMEACLEPLQEKSLPADASYSPIDDNAALAWKTNGPLACAGVDKSKTGSLSGDRSQGKVSGQGDSASAESLLAMQHNIRSGSPEDTSSVDGIMVENPMDAEISDVSTGGSDFESTDEMLEEGHGVLLNRASSAYTASSGALRNGFGSCDTIAGINSFDGGLCPAAGASSIIGPERDEPATFISSEVFDVVQEMVDFVVGSFGYEDTGEALAVSPNNSVAADYTLISTALHSGGGSCGSVAKDEASDDGTDTSSACCSRVARRICPVEALEATPTQSMPSQGPAQGGYLPTHYSPNPRPLWRPRSVPYSV